MERLGTGLLANTEGAMVTGFQPIVMVESLHHQDGKQEGQNNE